MGELNFCQKFGNMLLHLFLLFGSCTAVIVDTKYGKVKGYPFTSRNQREVWSFSGIRYATPPLGCLRFKDPKPPIPYDGVRDVKVSTPCFSNFNDTVDPVTPGEDCLQLAVFTPSLNSTKLYPVLVWFHGGLWVFSAGEPIDGPQFFMDYDIVVVEVEFRLGILGLLTLENNVMPGNLELKDQILALKWVQENIAFFKGDPKKVTVMGQSAGAAAVNYHMISPLSRGLFHQAVCMSGVDTVPWGLAWPRGMASSITRLYSVFLGCFSFNDNDILLCLQKKNNTFFILQYPVIDSYAPHPVIPVNPQLVESLPIPLFAGINNLDGLLVSQLYQRFSFIYGFFDLLFSEVAPYLLVYFFSSKKLEVSKRIRHYYFDDQPITNQSFANLTNLYSDRFFIWPLLEALNLHKGPTYVYNNAYNNSRTDKLGLTGSVHIDTTFLLWQQYFYKPSPRDEYVSKKVVKVFADFVIYGTPTPKGSSSFHWPLWNNKTQAFITIDTYGNFREDHGFYTDRMKFWQQLHNFSPDIDVQ